MSRQRRLALAATALCLGLNAGQQASAQSYPTQPIKIIVAAAPGGPSDFPARLAAQILPPRLGQPVVVENRGGAGGAIGARAAANSAPDGYTLMIGNTSTLAVIPAVSASAGYDPVKDFAPIAKVTEGFQILVVHPSSPWKSIKELVDYAKANPGKLNYAHTGAGGLPHLAGELFMLRSGAKMTGVSYRSGGESNSAVLSNAVDLTLENIAILGALIRDGKLRALAVANKTRSPLLPDVPTMAEAGVPDAEANTFFGLVAPAGTPASVIDKLNAAMNEGVQAPDIHTKIANLGTEAKPGSPEDFAAFIAAQHRKWTEVGKAAGVKID
jgi:tripartite-type tricarboxylate transporter receptor subunit TctC